jgi:RHS repeat-associated protein
MSPPRGTVHPPPSASPSPPRSESRPATRTPPPAPPLIGPTGSPTLDCMADAINSAAAPFRNAPPAEQGTAGAVAQYLGGALGLIGAPAQLIDNAFAGLTAPIAALFPAMPAITLLGMHIGMLHTHTHPPSLIPPAPPVPLPSIGMLVGSGSMAVLGCGMPLARAGDIGISVTCGSLAPPFEVFTGSSNVFVGGARAARILDITKHCDPTAMGPFGIAMAAAGVAAGAAGAIATGGAAAAAQAAADAAVLALKLLLGKDPGLPPGVGALLGPPCPTVMVGGFPCPPVGDMAIGALMKALKKLAAAARRLRSSRRANSHCGDGSHPIYLVTGENFDRFTDFVSQGLFRFERYYSTALAHIDGPLGFGFRHCYQRHLDVRLHRITFLDWDGVELEFPKFDRKQPYVRSHGYVLRRVSREHYELSTAGQPTMVFTGDPFEEVLPLVALRSDERELTFEYDARGFLVAVHDHARQFVDRRIYQFSHDPLGRIVGIHEHGKEGPIARFACSYTAAGELGHVRNASNGLWTYEYDAAHRWTRQADPRGYAYSFRYDQLGRCVFASGQDGLWAAEIEYLPDKRLTRCTESGGVWEYHYNPAGFITKIVNPQGAARVRKHDEEGRVLAQIDPGGRTLTYLYDDDGALTGRMDRFGYVHPPESPRLADPLLRRLPNTALARVFAGAIEAKPEAMLGATGRLLEIPPELRSLGHAIVRLRARGAPAIAPPIRNWHDALGKRIYEIDGLNRAQRFEYDEAGNQITRLDRDGRVHRRVTSSWNLLGTRIDPLGNAVHYQYSSVEQPTGLVDPLGNATRWTYDRGQRLQEVWRDDRLIDVYEYDDGDHFVAKYDGAGQLVFRNVEIHANHLVARRELASGGEHRFDYDLRGRVIAASTEAHEVEIAYGLGGLRTRDLRDGEGIERELELFDERIRVLGRFEWRRHTHRDGTIELVAPTGVTAYIRHADDGIILRECSNGTREWLQYDHEGRLEGRMTSRAAADGQHVGWGVRYGYSKVGDLLSIADSARGTTQFEVDGAHRLLVEIPPRGEPLRYEHDAASNLIHKPGLSRLQINPGNRASASATEVFEYDARGRMIARQHRDGAGARYIYDSFDMLVRVELRDQTGDHHWRAAYDAIGRRLWAEFDGQRREFYWDGDRLAAELAPNGTLRIYLYAGPEALVPCAFVDYENREAQPTSGRVYQVFANAVGMPLHIEDERREIIWWATRIDPFGHIDVHESAQLEYNLRWPGHYRDPELGLHYNRHRYYDPGLARYLTPDPVGHSGSEINLYAYCPNPLVQVDVLGLAHRPAGADGSEGSGNDGRSRPPGDEEPPPPRRLTREEGQAACDAIHAAQPEKARKNSTTSITELENGTLVVTNSDGMRPSMREKAREVLGPNVVIPDERGSPNYIPPANRGLADPQATTPLHGEGRGMQAGDQMGSPAARQWSSSDANHGGAACPGCEASQARRGVANETGFQSGGGRFDRGGGPAGSATGGGT